MKKACKSIADTNLIICGGIFAPRAYTRLGNLMAEVRRRLNQAMKEGDILVWTVGRNAEETICTDVSWKRDGREVSSVSLTGGSNYRIAKGEGEKIALLLIRRSRKAA